MSYILDALRKADAERERGAASELLGAPPTDRAEPPPEPARHLPVWLWLAVGAVIPLGALLAWRWAAPDEPAPVVAAVSASAPAPVAAPVAAPEPAPAPTAAAEAASAVEVEAPDAAAAAPPPASAPPARPAHKAQPPKLPAVAAATPSARAAPRPGPVSAPVRAFAELPEDLRRQVPPMTIGGSVYSPQPASRMLIVNGQVVREGATLAPGLQLESIGRQSAVFSIRGQRFSMPL